MCLGAPLSHSCIAPRTPCPAFLHRHPPARRKILGLRRGDELVDHVGCQPMEGLYEHLQLPLCRLIEAELKPPVVIAGVVRLSGGCPRTAAFWKARDGHLTHGMPQPRSNTHAMGICGLLYLLEHRGFHQHRHEVMVTRDQGVDGRSIRVSEHPLRHQAQVRCPFSGERSWSAPPVWRASPRPGGRGAGPDSDADEAGVRWLSSLLSFVLQPADTVQKRMRRLALPSP